MLIRITIGTFRFRVSLSESLSMFLFGSDFALVCLFKPGQKILSPKAISRAGSKVSEMLQAELRLLVLLRFRRR